MSRLIVIFFIFVFNIYYLNGQDNVMPSPNENILYQLEWILESGNPRYLRDVASFLDDEKNGVKALEILKFNTLFPDEKIDLRSNPGKQQFYDFYYTYQDSIKYSHLLNAFYLNELELIDIDFKINRPELFSPNELLTEFCFKLQSTESIDKIEIVENIRSLQLEYGIAYNEIFNCIPFSNDEIKALTTNAENAIYFNPEDEVLNEIKQKKLSNLSAKAYGFELEHVEKNLQDSIILLIKKDTPAEIIKNLYLEETYDTKQNFYYEQVDFYGTTLCSNLEKGNAEMLIASLLKTKDPKLLYYLSIYNFKLSKKENDLNISNLIKNLSQIEISENDEFEQARNNLIYWSKNYLNFEWDEQLKRFISEEERKENTKNLEKLIRRLNSKNDSVAVASYRQLSEADPSTLEQLLSKYRNIMTKINPSIPSLKYNYLEILSKIVALSKENDLDYKGSILLQNELALLKFESDQKKRYKLENKILSLLNTKNICSIEYWAILNSKNQLNTYSAGRILDIFYSRNWNDILKEQTLFSNYVKTAVIFRTMDGAGSCKNYHKKFNLNDKKLLVQIEKIKEVATDKSLLEGIDELLELCNNENNLSSFDKEIDYEELLPRLQLMDKIDYKSFNLLVEDDHIFMENKDAIISLINKIHPQKDIRKLALKEVLSLRDLEHFENKDYSVKELSSMIRFFKGEDPQNTIKFFQQKSINFDLEDKAYIANHFFRNQWFLKYLDNTKVISQECQEIMVTLTDYLMESEYISEIEDRTTQLNIILISMIGMSLEEKLQLSISMDIEQATRAELQKNIVSKVSYSDIANLLYFVDGIIDKNGNNDISFLNKDFGLPIFKFESVKQINEMRKRHQNLSQQDFYMAYLKDFGVDFLAKRNKLDYEKIVEILNYDLTYRFLGRGGGHRDYFVYGIIKILELEFRTTLGYSEKLNEFQTFYKYTSNARAKDWINYLIKNGYLESYKLVPSFYN